MSNKNLSFWEKVEKSDPASIKTVTLGRTFSTIQAQYQIKKATEMFGPFGKNWGIKGERFFMLNETILLYQAIFWWKEKDGDVPVNEFDISSSISVVFGRERRPDDECAKKVATDALTKGLSKLGFNADVFLGRWDDNKYVAKLQEEAKKAEDKKTQDELMIRAQEVVAKAKGLAEKGNIEAVRTLWKNNPELHKMDFFVTNVKEAGKKASEVASKSESDEEGAEGS